MRAALQAVGVAGRAGDRRRRSRRRRRRAGAPLPVPRRWRGPAGEARPQAAERTACWKCAAMAGVLAVFVAAASPPGGPRGPSLLARVPLAGRAGPGCRGRAHRTDRARLLGSSVARPGSAQLRGPGSWPGASTLCSRRTCRAACVAGAAVAGPGPLSGGPVSPGRFSQRRCGGARGGVRLRRSPRPCRWSGPFWCLPEGPLWLGRAAVWRLRALPPFPPASPFLVGGVRARVGRRAPAGHTRTVAERLRALSSGRKRRMSGVGPWSHHTVRQVRLGRAALWTVECRAAVKGWHLSELQINPLMAAHGLAIGHP